MVHLTAGEIYYNFCQNFNKKRINKAEKKRYDSNKVRQKLDVAKKDAKGSFIEAKERYIFPIDMEFEKCYLFIDE